MFNNSLVETITRYVSSFPTSFEKKINTYGPLKKEILRRKNRRMSVKEQTNE